MIIERGHTNTFEMLGEFSKGARHEGGLQHKET
jgi:hypothetical protein